MDIQTAKLFLVSGGESVVLCSKGSFFDPTDIESCDCFSVLVDFAITYIDTKTY